MTTVHVKLPLTGEEGGPKAFHATDPDIVERLKRIEEKLDQLLASGPQDATHD